MDVSQKRDEACRIITGTALVIMTWICENIVFNDKLLLIFRAHSRYLGRSQWSNHGEGAWAPLAKSRKKLNLNIRAFKQILDLTEVRGAVVAWQFLSFKF